MALQDLRNLIAGLQYFAKFELRNEELVPLRDALRVSPALIRVSAIRQTPNHTRHMSSDQRGAAIVNVRIRNVGSGTKG
jgi:ribosomal protein S6